MATKKADLPTKVCAACGRAFTWRKKWKADWEQVRFCSDACRTGRRAAARARIGTHGVQKGGQESGKEKGRDRG